MYVFDTLMTSIMYLRSITFIFSSYCYQYLHVSVNIVSNIHVCINA